MAKNIEIYKFNTFENAIIYGILISSHFYAFLNLFGEIKGS
jgi:hypothetical protein